MNYVIGAGGTGSWLVPSLCLLTGRDRVIVVDGDRLEERNLNRQLFTSSDVGRYKAEALAERYGCGSINDWFSFGDRSYDEHDVLIVLVDNHPARAAALQTCDYCKCRAIFAANEVHSSEAWYYQPGWRETNLDPRVFYPEILTNTDGDPRAAAIGCTGEAQEKNRQLVSANFSAASLAQHLFVVWIMEAPKLPISAREHLPHKLVQNLSRSETFKAQIIQ